VRHITFNDASRLYDEAADRGISNMRIPQPFPGRTSPTRVAWRIEIGEGIKAVKLPNPNYDGSEGTPQLIMKVISAGRIHVHTYVGKPNRYRALEALRLLAQPGLMSFWAMEFDIAGVLGYYGVSETKKRFAANNLAYIAYHPHSAAVAIIQSFAKPLYLKRIGGLTVYSHARKLTMERLDAYYDWYKNSFGKALKRPKQKALELSNEADQV
jgi:hypothetical protein